MDEYMNSHGMDRINVTNSVTFRGITYANGMIVCVGRTRLGNYLIRSIQLILIDETSQLLFVGKTDEIVFCEELGVYEIVDYETQEPSYGYVEVFPHSCLLCPDPLLQSNMNSVPVLVAKCTPFDPDL
ncbi:hypothetical protein QAD02_013768 [Eretmocerus hayati]|uniref:Uncharacterized protein n=1 Tax=Eretmocerus hayati TaxID=131215 RepID=A0ACC2P565_9HYME|nr:hypothetical protein QAD02_013768 [Eretmocerus hayati]